VSLLALGVMIVLRCQKRLAAPDERSLTMTKTWFITGTSKGFGRIFAEAALDRGDSVAASARDVSTLDVLVDTYGDAVLPLELDVTDRIAVLAASLLPATSSVAWTS
jgi:NADP-dependent 3-hydroxy acid dehydrogenase YdfG